MGTHQDIIIIYVHKQTWKAESNLITSWPRALPPSWLVKPFIHHKWWLKLLERLSTNQSRRVVCMDLAKTGNCTALYLCRRFFSSNFAKSMQTAVTTISFRCWSCCNVQANLHTHRKTHKQTMWCLSTLWNLVVLWCLVLELYSHQFKLVIYSSLTGHKTSYVCSSIQMYMGS